MTQIKSYLLKPDLGPFGPNDLVQYPKKYLIPIEDTEEILKIKSKIEFGYINGAIEIVYNGKEILSIKKWDYIDITWAYILNILEDYCITGCGETDLPDQAYHLAFKKHSINKLLVMSGEKTFFIHEKQEFINVLLNGAKEVLDVMNTIFKPSHGYKPQYQKIKFIRNHIQDDTD